MKKYKGNVLKLRSNLFFRIILCMVLMLFGALYVRFSNSCVAYTNNDDIEKYNQKIQIASVHNSMNYCIDEEVIYVNLNEKENEYVMANLDTCNKYPENWIGNFNKKIIALQKIFPSGKYWNHMGKEATNPEKSNNM